MKHKIFILLLALVASVTSANAAITVYLYNPNSSSTKWNDVYLWAWTATGNEFPETWPGKKMTMNENHWYSYTFSEGITSVNIIWNNGTDQTKDIEGITKTSYFALNEKTGKKIDVTVYEHLNVEIYDEDQEITYDLDIANQTATLLHFSKHISGDFIIPSSVTYNKETYSVTGIGEKVFYEHSGLTSIAIPNTITTIGKSAFTYCSGLKKVHISDLAA